MLKRRLGSFLLVVGLASLFLFAISLQAPKSPDPEASSNFDLFLIGLAASTAGYFLMKGALSEDTENESPQHFRSVKRMAAIRRGEIPKPERKKRVRRKRKKKGESEEKNADADTSNGDGEEENKPE